MALAKNSLLSLIPSVAGVVVGIVTVPLYISIVGTERYGALLLAWVFLGYFGQADFGLGRAVTQRLSSRPDATSAERASVVSTALMGAGVIALVGAALVYFATEIFFGTFFQADPVIKAEALATTWLFALCIPVIMFTGVSAGAMVGMERFGAVSAGTTIGTLLSQTLPLLVAVFYSVELSWLLGASLVGRTLGLALIVVRMWQTFLIGRRAAVSRTELKMLFSFGAWIMVTAIVGPLMTMSDRVVIGAAIGAAAVVAYSVPFQIAQRTIMLPFAVVQALFPRLASQSADRSTALGKVSVVLVGQSYAFVVVGLICLAEPLLELWLGDGLDRRSILVGQIALIGFWTNALANVPYALIQARGNPRFTAIVHLIELPFYFALLYVLGMNFGLFGIALAFSIRAFADCIIMFAKAGLAEGAVLVKLAGPAAIILTALAVSSRTGDWSSAIAAATILGSILLAICWFQMPGEVKDKLSAKFSG
jgi:O-antigen/teichoic acid export membrane protein